ncbi:MAG: cupin domain-containing protein [Myxococcota bacterium]|nr:cupin domain-containing protein [Myxococcota bacterium]
MKIQKVDSTQLLRLFTDHWAPKIIAELNDYQIKLVKIQGDFVWHAHEDTDELFFVLEGEMGIELKEKTLFLSKGEMVVVPKGVLHKPFAREECHVMLIEPRGVVNTGKAGGDKTAAQDVWITPP